MATASSSNCLRTTTAAAFGTLAAIPAHTEASSAPPIDKPSHAEGAPTEKDVQLQGTSCEEHEQQQQQQQRQQQDCVQAQPIWQSPQCPYLQQRRQHQRPCSLHHRQQCQSTQQQQHQHLRIQQVQQHVCPQKQQQHQCLQQLHPYHYFQRQQQQQWQQQSQEAYEKREDRLCSGLYKQHRQEVDRDSESVKNAQQQRNKKHRCDSVTDVSWPVEDTVYVDCAALPCLREMNYQTTALHAAPHSGSHSLLSPSPRMHVPSSLFSAASPSASDDVFTAVPAARQGAAPPATAASGASYFPLQVSFALSSSSAVAVSNSIPSSPAPPPPGTTAVATAVTLDSPQPNASTSACVGTTDALASVAAAASGSEDEAGTLASSSAQNHPSDTAACKTPTSCVRQALYMNTLSSQPSRSQTETAGNEGGGCGRTGSDSLYSGKQRQQQCASVLVGAAACWVYAVSLLTLQTPLPAATFCTAHQQRAFRIQLLLLPLLRVAIALYLLLAFFEEPANPAALNIPAALRHKPPQYHSNHRSGVQTPSTPPSAQRLSAATNAHPAAVAWPSALPHRQATPSSYSEPPCVRTPTTPTQTLPLHAWRMRGGLIRSTREAPQQSSRESQPRAPKVETHEEAGWPLQSVKISTTLCRRLNTRMPNYQARYYVRSPYSMRASMLHASFPAAAAAVPVAIPWQRLHTAVRRHRRASRFSSLLSERRLASAANRSAVLLSREQKRKQQQQQTAPLLHRTDANDLPEEEKEETTVLLLQQQHQPRKRTLEWPCNCMHRAVRRASRHCYTGSRVNMLPHAYELIGLPRDVWMHQGEFKQAQPPSLLQEQGGLSTSVTHDTSPASSLEQPLKTDVDSPLCTGARSIISESTINEVFCNIKPYAVALPIAPSIVGSSATNAGGASSLFLTNLLYNAGAAADDAIELPCISPIHYQHIHSGDAIFHRGLSDATNADFVYCMDTTGSAAEEAPASTSRSKGRYTTTALPQASNDIATAATSDNASMQHSSSSSIDPRQQQRPNTSVGGLKKPLSGQQQRQSLDGTSRALGTSAQQQQQNHPQQTFLLTLGPWWERLLHLVAAMGCLLLFLATALLECTYRGCCFLFAVFLSRQCSRWRPSSLRNVRTHWTPTSNCETERSDSRLVCRSDMGDDMNNRSYSNSSQKTNNVGSISIHGGNGSGLSDSSRDLLAAKMIKTGLHRLCGEKVWLQQANECDGEKSMTAAKIRGTAARNRHWTSKIRNVLPGQLLLLLVGCIVSLTDVIIAGTLLLQLSPSACATPTPGGRSPAASCLSAAVAAAAGKASSKAASAFLSLYKPLFLFRLARPLLLALLCHPVLMMLLRIVRTLPKVKTIVLATFLSVLLFDWLGVILFAGTGSHDEFHSFGRGCVSLLLVVTTVRLPQVLLQGYAVHEVAVLFIVLFYLLTAVLLGLFAAAFYTAYRDADIKDRQRQKVLALRYVRYAFDYLLRAQHQHQQLRQQHDSDCRQQGQEAEQRRQHDKDFIQPFIRQQVESSSALIRDENKHQSDVLHSSENVSSISQYIWLQFYVAYMSLPEALHRVPSSTGFDEESVKHDSSVEHQEEEEQEGEENILNAAEADFLRTPFPLTVSQQQDMKQQHSYKGGQQEQERSFTYQAALRQQSEDSVEHPSRLVQQQQRLQGKQQYYNQQRESPSDMCLLAHSVSSLGLFGASATGAEQKFEAAQSQKQRVLKEVATRRGDNIVSPLAAATPAIVQQRPVNAEAAHVADTEVHIPITTVEDVEHGESSSSQVYNQNSARAAGPPVAQRMLVACQRAPRELLPQRPQTYNHDSGGGGGIGVTPAAAYSNGNDNSSWGLAEAGLYDVKHYVARASDSGSSNSVAVVGTASECEEHSVFTDEISSSSSIVLGTTSLRNRRPSHVEELLLQPTRSPGTRHTWEGRKEHHTLQEHHQQQQQPQQEVQEQSEQHENGKYKDRHTTSGDVVPLLKDSRQQLLSSNHRSQSPGEFPYDGTEYHGDSAGPCIPSGCRHDIDSNSRGGDESLAYRSSFTEDRTRVKCDDDDSSCSSMKMFLAPTHKQQTSSLASDFRQTSVHQMTAGTATEAGEIFQLLDTDHTGTLSWENYGRLVHILAQYKGEKKKEEENRWNSKSSGDPLAVRRRQLNTAADICVAVSLLLTYMQTRKFIKTASNLTGDEIEASPVDLAEGMPASCFGSVAGVYWLQNALSATYLISVIVRVSTAASLKRYTGLSLRERFDMLVGVAVMTLEAACLWAGSASAFHPSCATETFDDLSRSLAFVRVLRGVRLCFRVSALRKMITSLVAAVAALNTVLLLLIVVFCTYATLGMELFGGIIKCDMEHLPPKGPDMEDPTDWGVLNFNHFFASLVTLFLLTVNGWDDSLKALVKQTSVMSCGAYFVSFYLLTDTIILNLLVALVLEAYEQIVSSASHKRPKGRSREELSDARVGVLERFCKRSTRWWPAIRLHNQRNRAP